MDLSSNLSQEDQLTCPGAQGASSPDWGSDEDGGEQALAPSGVVSIVDSSRFSV